MDELSLAANESSRHLTVQDLHEPAVTGHALQKALVCSSVAAMCPGCSHITLYLLICSCNALLCPAVYIFISQRLFHLTNELKDRIVPHDDNPKLARNILQGALAATAVVGLGWLIQRMVVLQLFL